MGQDDVKMVQKIISDAVTDLKQYIDQRQSDGFEDMKQYVDTNIKASEQRLSAQIKDLSVSIGMALDTPAIQKIKSN